MLLSPDQYRERYKANVHTLPSNPTPMDYIFFVPRALYKFVHRLCDAFGFKVRGDSRDEGMNGWVVD